MNPLPGRPWPRRLGVLAALAAVTFALTYPLGVTSQSVARLNGADAQYAIWNEAWVAHALLTDPRHVLDANIFYPHTRTLVYSDANLFAGLLATPIYWATGNAYAAHNFVVVLSFLLSAVATYALVHYLVRDWRAAGIAAISFAFTPHVFSHLSHIQLLMTAVLPLSLLALHRLVDRPSPARALALGLAVAAAAYASGYYGFLAGISVAFAALVMSATRGLWRSPRYWGALLAAGAIAVGVVLPLAVQYFALQRGAGFERALDEARVHSADWRAYFASAAYAHVWMLSLLDHWKEVLFPGFVTLGLAAAAVGLGWRMGDDRRREQVLVYSLMALLALWISLGPAAGLYTVLYQILPGFSFMRASSRFGVMVLLGLSVLAGIGMAALSARVRRPALFAAMVFAVALAESVEPLGLRAVPEVLPVYRVLAALPRAALLELPVYSRQFAARRTSYMLGSIHHWQPLVVAYSDFTPPEFVAATGVLGQFPTAESLALMKRDGVRYALFHLRDYSESQRKALDLRLHEFRTQLRPLYADADTRLFEIIYP